ncbi:MAG TPA: methyltransferase [Bacteroidia bacterium]|nr:methyltransferase [Bacteroidia bacterium]
MPESVFQFKKFSVSQDRSAMKVGTDGVLLGAWVMPASAAAILDIGTGTGLIALMLAQKSTAFIDAIDIDRDSCSQAIENVSQSPWPDKIKIVNCPLQEFRPGKRYDLIVSNPPYFIDSFAATDEARNITLCLCIIIVCSISRWSSEAVKCIGTFLCNSSLERRIIF